MDPFKPWEQLRRVLVREDWTRMLRLLLAMVVVMVLQVTGVASILPFMQLVAQPGVVEQSHWMKWIYDTAGFESERQMLLWTGAAVFCLFTLSVLLTALLNWQMQRSLAQTAHCLSIRQLQTFMELPYEYFVANSSSELLRRTVADINTLLIDVLLAGSQIIAQTLLAVGLLALMFFMHAGVALAAITVFAGAYSAIHLLRHAYAVRLGKMRIDADQQRYATFVDAITGMKSIRVANASAYFASRFDKASEAYSRIYPRLHLVMALPRHLMEILAFGGILLAVLILVGAGGDFSEVVPLLSFFALATYRLMPALHTIFDGAGRFSSSLPVIDAIARDLVPRPADAVTGQASAAPRSTASAVDARPSDAALSFEREICLNRVSFRYRGAEAPTLRDVELRVEKGARVALVGTTGAGKTTLVDLAVGLLLPTSGALTVDDTPIDAVRLAQWRKHIAYVPQDVFLFDASIAANIAFGSADIDFARMRTAARIAQIDDFIVNELDGGYDFLVGERGVRLSGGQRQRIGIARALYRDPDVLLLDEATNGLDNVTEAAVMAALQRQVPDLTVIAIAHRLSTIRSFDRIYLIDGGRVSDRGSFEDLYRRNDRFQRMVDASSDAGTGPATK
ncbi:MAG: ABC transporter ATP-binding protein [Rhodocyclaceae bacterium]|nr:ABC transporter ATP-binding protein [Rhodocyclaceae bacterium]